MNYLAHGFRHADDPWMCAGTALPDWARVISPGGTHLRVPEDAAAHFTADADARLASIARGVVRHHADDRVFHQSAAFTAATAEAAEILAPLRAEVPELKIRFVAHVCVEMLLDAALIEDQPSRLDRYYAALGSLDPDEIESLAARIANGPVAGLARLVGLFVRARLLADYADDARLSARLEQVALRIGQPPCASALRPRLPALRARVRLRRDALVAPALRADI